MYMASTFYKENPNDKISWAKALVNNGDSWDIMMDVYLFSFDEKKVYSLYEDYPQNMTDEEIEIFNKEQPEFAERFSSKLKEYRASKK